MKIINVFSFIAVLFLHYVPSSPSSNAPSTTRLYVPSRTSMNVWTQVIVFAILFLAVILIMIRIGRCITMKRIAYSKYAARMNRIPDGPVVSSDSAGLWHTDQHLYSAPTIPTYEEAIDGYPVPDGPRVHQISHRY